MSFVPCRMTNDAQVPVVGELDRVVGLPLEVGAEPVVVELLLSAGDGEHAAIELPRLGPVPREVEAHPAIVGAIQEGEVVHLEAGAAPVGLGLPLPRSVLLRQPRVQPVAAHRRRRGIVDRAEQPVRRHLAVGTLEVVRARPLGELDGVRRPAHVGQGECPAPPVRAVVPRVAPVDPRGARVAAQLAGEHGVVTEPAHGVGRHDADRRRALPQLLAHAAHEVVGQRLHGLRELGLTGGGEIARGFASGHRVEHADGVAAAGAAGDLRGAEDGGVVRRIDVRGLIVHPSVELRRPADAPRVQHAEPGEVAAEHAAGSAEVERVRGWRRRRGASPRRTSRTPRG